MRPSRIMRRRHKIRRRRTAKSYRATGWRRHRIGFRRRAASARKSITQIMAEVARRYNMDSNTQQQRPSKRVHRIPMIRRRNAVKTHRVFRWWRKRAVKSNRRRRSRKVGAVYWQKQRSIGWRRRAGTFHTFPTDIQDDAVKRFQMVNKKRPAAPVEEPIKHEITIPFIRLPELTHLRIFAREHKKWLNLVDLAEDLVRADITTQQRSAKGLRIKDRSLPPELLGRYYAKYCRLINRMYDSYLRSVQLQRCPYMLDIIGVLIKRMYELRNELVHYIVNDYIYVDKSLQQLFLTPNDIQIVVPYHFPLESRSDAMEELLQTMWEDAIERRERGPEEAEEESESDIDEAEWEDEQGEEVKKMRQEKIQERKKKKEFKEVMRKLKDMAVEEEEIEEGEDELDSEAEEERRVLNYVLDIQRQTRYRQWFLSEYVKKSKDRRTYTVIKEAPIELQNRAAKFIQNVFRSYHKHKVTSLIEHKRDIMLDLAEDDLGVLNPGKPKYNLREEREKLYEMRRKKRKLYEKEYAREMEKHRTRLLLYRKGQIIEEISEEIREWFKYWYETTHFFPTYPSAIEGGTVLLVSGEYPTVQEQRAADETWRATYAGKTSKQLKEMKDQEKKAKEQRIEAEKARKIAEAQTLFTLRCNPDKDPGYRIQMSAINEDITNALHQYRQCWSLSDHYSKQEVPDSIYGYMLTLLIEDIMVDLQKGCRAQADELMRLERKLLIDVQKKMFKDKNIPWPKFPPEPKAKIPKSPPKPLSVDDTMKDELEEVFDLDIMSRPKTKIEDIQGDFSYRNYEINIADPGARFPSPSYGDVRRRLLLSCVYGCGIEPMAGRHKAVLLIGVPRNGKSFLVDAVAGELNAVKFDISPDVLGPKTGNAPAKMLASVFLAARVFQPSVIFLKNIEQCYYKYVPGDQIVGYTANTYKKPLAKLIKAISVTDKVIFIATCSDPFNAKLKPMMKLFSETIYVPAVDYGSLQRFFSDNIPKRSYLLRQNFNINFQPLCQALQGIGFGALFDILDWIFRPERVVKFNAQPFELSECMEYVFEHNIDLMDENDYEKWMNLILKYSPLKKEREEYTEINKSRALRYKKLLYKKSLEEQERLRILNEYLEQLIAPKS